MKVHHLAQRFQLPDQLGQLHQCDIDGRVIFVHGHAARALIKLTATGHIGRSIFDCPAPIADIIADLAGLGPRETGR
jgi:hypothetical protein